MARGFSHLLYTAFLIASSSIADDMTIQTSGIAAYLRKW